MVRLGWTALVAAVAIAGTAQAQVSKVTTAAGSSNSVPTNFGAGKGEGPGGAYNSFVSVKKNAITFESSNAATGPYTYTSASNVNLTITNHNTATVSPKVHSQITPAGLGFYLADISKCSPGYGTCAQATGVSFADLNLGSSPVTLASFDFSIATGDATLYRAAGSVGVMLNSFGEVTTWQTFNHAATFLSGFGVETGDASSFGYNWDATDVNLNLPVELATGQSATVRYNTTVSTYSPPLCLGSSTICMVSYAGFGDPIGRGGGVDSLSAIRPFDIGGGGPIGGLQFDSFTMYTDNYRDGILDTTTPGNSGAPEPAVWISMVLGFGLLGGALRRRRALAIA